MGLYILSILVIALAIRNVIMRSDIKTLKYDNARLNKRITALRRAIINRND